MKGNDIMSQKKITKKEMFAQIKEMLVEIGADVTYTDFIDHEIELLNKKSTSKKETAKQIENKNLSEKIFSAMEIGEKYLCSDIQKLLPELAEFQNQKIYSLIRPLYVAGFLTREEIKGKAYFSKA